jgi:hypothetical protein
VGYCNTLPMLGLILERTAPPKPVAIAAGLVLLGWLVFMVTRATAGAAWRRLKSTLESWRYRRSRQKADRKMTRIS